MTGLGFFWDILIVAGGIFIILAILGTKAGKRDAQKAIHLLKKIESIYDKYVTQKIVNSIITAETLEPNIEQFVNEIITILKPEIEGLINLINVSIYTGISVPHDSPYFSNIVTLIEQYFDTSQKNEEKKLTKAEIEKLYDDFRVAITADVNKRLLDY